MRKNIHLLFICAVLLAAGIIWMNGRKHIPEPKKDTSVADKRLVGEDRTSQMPEEMQEKTPEEQDGSKMPLVADILTGDDYCIALCEDGSVWSWGNNESGKHTFSAVDSVGNYYRINMSEE